MAKFATIVVWLREYGGLWVMRGVAVLTLAFLFFIAIGGISQNDRWKITRVEIIGGQTVDSDIIESLVREKLKGNYYFVYARENSEIFPQRDVEESLMNAFPRLASVYATRVDTHTISIKVSERKPYALWCGEAYLGTGHPSGGCWFIDETGFVFDRAPIFSEGVYLEVYGKLNSKHNESALRVQMSPSQFILVHTLTKALTQKIGNPLRIILKPEGEITVTIDQSTLYPILARAELHFKDGTPVEALIKNLLIALPVQFPSGMTSKKKLLYIDMRFGNKIFFGFEN